MGCLQPNHCEKVNGRQARQSDALLNVYQVPCPHYHTHNSWEMLENSLIIRITIYCDFVHLCVSVSVCVCVCVYGWVGVCVSSLCMSLHM